MKTAISLPDPLFVAAEQYAHDKGMSRSELYAHALAYFLQAHRYASVTSELNQLYAEEESSLEPALGAAQTNAVTKVDW